MVIITLTSFAANVADSVNVRFGVGKRYFDPSLGNNRELMDVFIKKVRQAVETNDLDSVIVYGYASPDGPPKKNELLARARCASLAEYIVHHAGISPCFIRQRPVGIGWDELRRFVAANPDVPSRGKVLDILDHTPLYIFDAKGNIIDGRKKQLMDLAGGRPYRWMMNNIFPDIRNAVALSLCSRSALDKSDSVAQKPVNDESTEDLNLSRNSGNSNLSGNMENNPESNPEIISESQEIVESIDESEEISAQNSEITAGTIDTHVPIYRFALKTNMLYDAILMPNLELEWLISKKWSVAIDGNVAWWNRSYTKAYRIAYGTPEVRYHIKPQEEWHGMYVGVFAGGGFYDLCNPKRGYRGPLVMSGLSFGYMWPISRCFSLEAGVGVGYMYSRYKRYVPHDGHKVYLRTRDLHYFGPLKLKLSIAWRFYDVNRKNRLSENK